MEKTIIYIHGKGGNASEAEYYKPLFQGYNVIGYDYKAQTPWEAKEEFPIFFDLVSKNQKSIMLIANSIGAYFAMQALSDKKIDRAFFISPIVNMEKIILDMMAWEGITENDLQEKKEICTAFGETLSYEYLEYVRKHPIDWNIFTDVLYGEKDNITSRETMLDFVNRHNARLTEMKNGEHWFHTEEQMKFLAFWISHNTKS